MPWAATTHVDDSLAEMDAAFDGCDAPETQMDTMASASSALGDGVPTVTEDFDPLDPKIASIPKSVSEKVKMFMSIFFSLTVLFRKGKNVWKWFCGPGRTFKIKTNSQAIRPNCLCNRGVIRSTIRMYRCVCLCVCVCFFVCLRLCDPLSPPGHAGSGTWQSL